MVERRIQGRRMKYQEALFRDKYEIALETISDKDINIFERYKDCKDEAIKVLKEAIEKANKYDDLRTPKEKTWKANGKGKIIDCCPICKNQIKAFDRYCKNCGQALKWSEQ